jgi:hypothetical protein
MGQYDGLSRNQLNSRIKNRQSTQRQLNADISYLQKERDGYQREYNNEKPLYDKNKPLKVGTKEDIKRKIADLDKKILDIEKEIQLIDYNIKDATATNDQKYNYDLPEKNIKFISNKSSTSKIIKDVIPLKKQENDESENYYRLLSSQNNEVSMEINNQKHNLTTADRKYIVEDSKIPYYKELNNLLLIAYIIVAIYVSYKVFTGLITKNIYGKLIIILLISLYPIFIFNLEMVIYDQYKLIKSMIRAEPYEPVK